MGRYFENYDAGEAFAPDFTRGYELPPLWSWSCYADGSGHLTAPDGARLFSYDLSTGEIMDFDRHYSRVGQRDRAKWVASRIEEAIALHGTGRAGSGRIMEGLANDGRKGQVTDMPEQTQRNITIKEPESPASAAQMGLIGALAEAGVVSAEQMAALGDAPTKQAASDLIAAHSGEEAFKAVQEARRTAPAERRTPAQKEPQRADFAHVKMPAAFVTPHTLEAKDGRTFDKAYVRLPDGVEVNKVDLSGYSLDVFMTDRMKQQKLLGEPVMLSFKADERVTVWKGRKDDPDYKRFEVKPWDLVKAVNANNKEYEAAKQAERESALDAAAKEAREAADGLAGHDENVRPEQAR